MPFDGAGFATDDRLSKIDRVINPTQSPSYTGDPAQGLAGVARPTFQPTEHGVWFHGVSFGAEWRF